MSLVQTSTGIENKSAKDGEWMGANISKVTATVNEVTATMSEVTAKHEPECKTANMKEVPAKNEPAKNELGDKNQHKNANKVKERPQTDPVDLYKKINKVEERPQTDPVYNQGINKLPNLHIMDVIWMV